MTILISLALTLMVFSYLLGDNILFRVAVSIFVGLTAAFTVLVTFQSVIVPLSTAQNVWLLFISAVLTLLLLLKPFRSLRILTNMSLGFLIAVGAAIAVTGAIAGTIIPLISQTVALDRSAEPFEIFSSVIIIIGVVTSLLYFNYAAQRNAQGNIERSNVMKVVAGIGQGFIVITLGALYGAAILTSLTILTGQLEMLFGG